MRKVELLIKPVSYECNLNCKYCFYKKALCLYSGKNHRMRENVLERLISESMAYSGGAHRYFPGREESLFWQGLTFLKR